MLARKEVELDDGPCVGWHITSVTGCRKMHLEYLSSIRARGASDVKEKPIVDVIKVGVA